MKSFHVIYRETFIYVISLFYKLLLVYKIYLAGGTEKFELCYGMHDRYLLAEVRTIHREGWPTCHLCIGASHSLRGSVYSYLCSS